MHDSTSKYFDATQYAYAVLGESASRYFSRLHQLSRYNSAEELRSIIDGWKPATPPSPPAPGLWTPGSRWGDAVRVAHDRGIIWKMKCACGQVFEASTNDTIPEDHRKCPACLLADDLSATKQTLVFKLEETAKTVLTWYRDYGKLVWDRVHKACDKRGLHDDQFLRELHALCWAKIASVAGSYRDRGFKVSTWLTRVVDNCLRDHFKVNANRAKLAPTVPLTEDSRDAAAPPTQSEEVLPAKPVRPEGASPDGKNQKQANWDKRQGWNG